MAMMLVADELDRLTIRRVRAWHWLAARCRAGSLDRELISGMHPEECPYLAARALQLTSERSRRGLVAGLDRLLTADGRPTVFATAVPVRRARVAAAATELRALRDRLLAPGPLPARGVAAAATRARRTGTAVENTVGLPSAVRSRSSPATSPRRDLSEVSCRARAAR